MPVPQAENSFFVEQVGKPVHVRAGKMPVPQAENSLFVEQAGKPVLDNSAKCSIAHHRPSTFIYTEKFKIFDRIYRPKPDFRIELLSSVSFHLNLPP